MDTSLLDLPRVVIFGAYEAVMSRLAALFYPLLKPFFGVVDTILSPVYLPWARVAALGLFAAAIVWVFLLNEKYVNLDSPKKDIWHDLRLWTILCLAPHIVVYMFL